MDLQSYEYESKNYDKATSYVKKITKSKYYHSDTIRKKIEDKYGLQISLKVVKKLRSANFFNDYRYLTLLKELYRKKGYGRIRYENCLMQKNISRNYVCYYTLSEEKITIYEVYRKLKEKFQLLPRQEANYKIRQKLIYYGFSEEAIECIN